jgi:phosphatidylinositol glycan class V
MWKCNNDVVNTIQVALLSRIMLLIFMAISNYFVPNFDPGEDVLKFNSRLVVAGSESISHNNIPRFCGDRDDTCHSRRDPLKTSFRANHQFQRYKWLDKLYYLILPPLTRWDAARFLNIAVDPTIRNPSQPTTITATTSNTECFTTFHADDDETRNNGIADNPTCAYNYELITTQHKSIFTSSEQAHAFMPLLPLTIRFVANHVLLRIIPIHLLPSSYEGTCILSGFILNMLTFSLAAVMLQKLTLHILRRQQPLSPSKGLHTPINGESTISSSVSSRETDMAQLTVLLFCCNPANVFFTAIYSESLFAALTFTGYYLSEVHSSKVISILPWMMASYTRSNGFMVCKYLLLKGVCEVAYLYSCPPHQNGCRTTNSVKGLIATISYITRSFFVVVPLLYHDWSGYRAHCDTTRHILYPEWCLINNTKKRNNLSFFSLYTYVQRKHWNVGFLRYYCWKQLPNFLLATPILCLGIMATVIWIKNSWRQYISIAEQQQRDNEPQGTLRNIRKTTRWIRFALYQTKNCREVDSAEIEDRLMGPALLEHYAVLAGVCFLGATIAHVQVSTRLLCSSCPSLYWFMAYVIEKAKTKKGSDACFSYRSAAKAIVYYIFAFNLIGPVMHAAWLPWT